MQDKAGDLSQVGHQLKRQGEWLIIGLVPEKLQERARGLISLFELASLRHKLKP